MSHPEPVVPNRISAFGLLAFAALQIARDAYGEFGVRLGKSLAEHNTSVEPPASAGPT
jgi:hypothetical protein